MFLFYFWFKWKLQICFRDYLTFRGRPPSFQILANQLTLAPPEFSDLPTALELVSSIAKVSFFLVCPSYTLGCLKFDWISFLLEMVPNQFLINTVKLVFFWSVKVFVCFVVNTSWYEISNHFSRKKAKWYVL